MDNERKTNAPESTESTECRLQRRASWGWWIFAAVALFYLLTEHQAHLFGALPILLLLACPLMHFFMHRGHGAHHAHRANHAQREHNREDQP